MLDNKIMNSDFLSNWIQADVKKYLSARHEHWWLFVGSLDLFGFEEKDVGTSETVSRMCLELVVYPLIGS